MLSSLCESRVSPRGCVCVYGKCLCKNVYCGLTLYLCFFNAFRAFTQYNIDRPIVIIWDTSRCSLCDLPPHLRNEHNDKRDGDYSGAIAQALIDAIATTLHTFSCTNQFVQISPRNRCHNYAVYRVDSAGSQSSRHYRNSGTAYEELFNEKQ